MQIRTATNLDANAGSGLLRRSIKELCQADHNDDAAIIASWVENKTPAMWRQWLVHDSATLYVAVEAGNILGVGMIGHDGEIMLNYVSPDARWRGVTKALLAHMETDAQDRGLTRCSLESTNTARSFYEAAGYKSDTVETGRNGRMLKNLGDGRASS